MELLASEIAEEVLCVGMAGGVGLLGWFFGGLDGFVKVLLVFTVIDYISGVCVAAMHHKLESSVGFKGIAKKVIIFALVGVAHILDEQLLGDSEALRTAVCLFYIGNEGISIIENADKLGVPIPVMLKKKLSGFIENEEGAEQTESHEESHKENQENVIE